MRRGSEVTADRARSLLERVLRDGGSLAAEYPLIFEPEFQGRLLAIESEGDVRSACGVLLRDFRVGNLAIPGGLIGSVATDPLFRRRGLATRLLDQAERELAAEGALFALLWADSPGFYEARGYRPMGCEIDFVVDDDSVGRLPSIDGVRAAAPDDYGAIHRLYSRHRERVDRTSRETTALLSGPDIEVLVLQRAGDIVAYSCLGRGADLERTVHEWAGAAYDVAGLVRRHFERVRARDDAEPVYLISPAGATELHRTLSEVGIPRHSGMVGLGKLLDPMAAATLLATLAGPEASLSVDTRSIDEPRITLVGPRGEAALGIQDLFDVLFSPERGAATKALHHATGLALDELPVAFFPWGLDSI